MLYEQEVHKNNTDLQNIILGPLLILKIYLCEEFVVRDSSLTNSATIWVSYLGSSHSTPIPIPSTS